MDQVALKKTITIELDVISGDIQLENPDETSYVELLGMIEYAKMLVTRDWLEKR